MASSTSSSAEDPKYNLLKQIRSHEVSIAELNSLSSSRGCMYQQDIPIFQMIKNMMKAVYQKNGNIFFRTSVKSAIASEQKQADLAKAQLQKLNSA